ncbi:MAG: phosphoribosylformylglycinamidine cyclo-ligase [Proteobacteria bacterium]|nr:phosphoribosylformylglycinamidine cyclo-ligase [Pseudomonadota bacterium]
MTYKDAGVNIDEGNETVRKIKPLAKATFRPEVLSDIGHFSAFFSLNSSKYKEPVLVSSTDGVGTKLALAFKSGIHDTVGIDLVAMVVNDIIVTGAEPLFFLDYFACGKLSSEVAEKVISGISKGCIEAGCALIGGETAELPGFYKEGEYDLAGFGVGIVEKNSIIDGSNITAGDLIIGVASSGLHSNGYSLVRKVFFELNNYSIDTYFEELGKTLIEELLTPTRIYVKPVLNILKNHPIKGMAHITGGGFIENIPRILSQQLMAFIDKSSLEILPIFKIIQKLGNIDEFEMFRTFNCGTGLVIVVSKESADDIVSLFNSMKIKAKIIGEIKRREHNSKQIEIM